MRKLLPKKSKQGITLVESVVAVVLLAMFAIGVLTLLTSGGVKIQEISKDAAAYAEATQKLDLAISAISNGSTGTTPYIVVDATTGKCDLDDSQLISTLRLGTDVTLVGEKVCYDPSLPETADNVRGWYLELTFNGVTVKGFASNSEGVFDS